VTPQTRTSPRIWVLLAREAHTGVIFRRGPSAQVQLIRWDLQDDSFKCGQWFKGRIYERRCDLSPDGNYLIYFASKQKPPLYSWTAISKPPYFTALALWPKGDCWNGGGHFLTNKSFVLDHHELQSELAPGFRLKGVSIGGLATFRGEDAPVWETTMQRDGWTLSRQGRQQNAGGIRGWLLDPPECWTKPHPRKPLLLEMAIHGIAGKDQRGWYHIRYQVIAAEGDGMPEMDADWADWDRNGDLLYARNGKIYRQKYRHGTFQDPVELLDTTGHRFANVDAPAKARKW